MENLRQEATLNTDPTGDETAYSKDQTTYSTNAENINAQNQADDSFDTDDIQKNAKEEAQANLSPDMDNLRQEETNESIQTNDDQILNPEYQTQTIQEDRAEDSELSDAEPPASDNIQRETDEGIKREHTPDAVEEKTEDKQDALELLLGEIKKQQNDINDLRAMITDQSQKMEEYQKTISDMQNLMQPMADMKLFMENTANSFGEMQNRQDLIKDDLLADMNFYKKDIKNLRAMITDQNKKMEEYQKTISDIQNLMQPMTDMKLFMENTANSFDEMQSRQNLIKDDLLADMNFYKKGFVKGAMKPWMECIIDLFDHIWETYRTYQLKSSILSSGKYKDLLKEYVILQENILNTLEKLDIIPIIPEQGDSFEQEMMHICEISLCQDPNCNFLVKECFVPGFRYKDGTKLRDAQITIWKYECGE